VPRTAVRGDALISGTSLRNAPKGDLSKASVKLRAFAKTDLLQPGQFQVVVFHITAEDPASFDTETSS
jgi:hypothetical protein